MTVGYTVDLNIKISRNVQERNVHKQRAYIFAL